MEDLNTTQDTQEAAKKHPPEWPAVPAAAQEQQAQYFQKLLNYFRYEKEIERPALSTTFPLRFAPQLRKSDSDATTSAAPVTGQMALQLLREQTELHARARVAFWIRLRKVSTSLQELLLLHDDTPESPVEQLDFVEDLVALDKIKAVAAPKVSSRFSPVRQQRLRSAHYILETAHASYSTANLTIFSSASLVQSLGLAHIFNEADLQVAADTTACQLAKRHSQQQLEVWTQIIAALRMGELLVAQQYEEQLHDDYFDHFKSSYLSPEDLSGLPPILVIEESRKLLQQSADFLTLLTDESIVKILGINSLETLFDSPKQANAPYLELASLAIMRRNSYIFQGGLDAPELVERAYQKGLMFPGPVFWHLLLPGREMDHTPMTHLALVAAVESRYFPCITYETSANHFTPQQIDLGHNPSPTNSLATYETALKRAGTVTSQVFRLTPADFLALQAGASAALALIPPAQQNPAFIPLADYLSQPQDAVAGKIPFIWLVDEQHQLQRAVVPRSWVKACRNRLEYWDFLQYLAGTNEAQHQAALEAAQTEWERVQRTTVAQLEATLRAQFAQDRANDLQQAVIRMLSGLLNQDEPIDHALTRMSQPSAPTAAENQSHPTSPSVREAMEATKTAVKSVVHEAWVESEDCTSCRDCIEALPTVFNYNDNKQAYVHNPQGGTFAQIVTVAERCPASCIHPGKPQNKEEEGLDRWVERAEKFN